MVAIWGGGGLAGTPLAGVLTGKTSAVVLRMVRQERAAGLTRGQEEEVVGCVLLMVVILGVTSVQSITAPSRTARRGGAGCWCGL